MVQMIHLRTCHSVNAHIRGDKMTATRDAEWSGAHLGRGDGGDAGYFYIYIYFGGGVAGVKRARVDPWSGVTDSPASW